MYLRKDKANHRFKDRERSIKASRSPTNETIPGDYYRNRSASSISQESTSSSLKTPPSPTDIPIQIPSPSPSTGR